MGYKIAELAYRRRHNVTLISGPTGIRAPKVKKFISVESAGDLLTALKKEIGVNQCLIMCAAVSDFRPANILRNKLKRSGRLLLELVPNKDLLTELLKYKKDKTYIGFSLDTEDVLRNSRLKLKKKKLDIIVANRLTKERNPFGNNKLDGYIIDKYGSVTELCGRSKGFVANVLLDKIEKLWYLRQGSRQDPKR